MIGDENRVDVQAIAAIAWTCIKTCKDYVGPPVMCPAHQQEAEAIVKGGADSEQGVSATR